ncbi:hypothetical protein [Brevibacterium spongiae]|uniref:Uncharacterized protein n=1 Tax=Brevibacterium spongiae TaxID=2909672 RepID=A0ABY5SLV2_9MICO|nr:hypothetical protein [Brevibacterium spongiae]UVI35129.1 hypothetical protein L1F31_13525 [Brevibacterium spongiae]
MILRIELRPHWINGWFVRAFSTPFLLVGSTEDREYRLSWLAPTEVEVDERQSLKVGVGVRYFGRGALLGVSMSELPGESTSQTAPIDLTFRNGAWNHDPFVLAD